MCVNNSNSYWKKQHFCLYMCLEMSSKVTHYHTKKKNSSKDLSTDMIKNCKLGTRLVEKLANTIDLLVG
jgi:hypothetical protein